VRVFVSSLSEIGRDVSVEFLPDGDNLSRLGATHDTEYKGSTPPILGDHLEYISRHTAFSTVPSPILLAWQLY